MAYADHNQASRVLFCIILVAEIPSCTTLLIDEEIILWLPTDQLRMQQMNLQMTDLLYQ